MAVRKTTAWKRCLAPALLSLFLLVCAPHPAQAQYLGTVSPTSTSEIVLNAVSSPQVVAVPNLGQNIHLLVYTTTDPNANPLIRLEGSNDGIFWFPISPDATQATVGGLFAVGHFAVVRINLVSLSAGTLTATYSGTSAAGAPPTGIFQQGQSFRNVLGLSQNGTATQTIIFSPPVGHSAGRIIFRYLSVAPTVGSPVIDVWAGPRQSEFIQIITGFPIALNNSFQVIDVKQVPGPVLQVRYSAAGADQGTFSWFYISDPVPRQFCQPGSGTIRSIAGTDPAAGVEISETIPAGVRWRLISLHFTLVTDATVANRAVRILLDDGTNIYVRSVADSNQTASLINRYTAWSVGSGQTTSTSFKTIFLSPNLILPAGHRIRTVTTGIQAGDNLSAPQLLVEECPQ